MKWLFTLAIAASIAVSPVLRVWAAEDTVVATEEGVQRELGYMRKCLLLVAGGACE
jgi:hypothetical protein